MVSMKNLFTGSSTSNKNHTEESSEEEDSSEEEESSSEEEDVEESTTAAAPEAAGGGFDPTTTHAEDDYVGSKDDILLQQTDDPEEDHQKYLARRETFAVRGLRILMILALISVAVTSSVLVYQYSRRSETTEFHKDFAASAQTLVSGFQTGGYHTFQSLASASAAISRQAANDQWPFVTLPDSLFEPYMSQGNLLSIVLLPIVKPDQRKAWEQYSVEHQDWILQEKGVQLLQQQDNDATHEDEDKIQSRRLVRKHSINLRSDRQQQQSGRFRSGIIQSSILQSNERQSSIQSNTRRRVQQPAVVVKDETAGGEQAPEEVIKRINSNQENNTNQGDGVMRPAAVIDDWANDISSSNSLFIGGGVPLIPPFIHNRNGLRDPSEGPFSVWWQFAPVLMPNRTVNFNVYNWPGYDTELYVVRQEQLATTGPTILMTNNETQGDEDSEQKPLYDYVRRLVNTASSDQADEEEPIGPISYPIFNDNGAVPAVLLSMVSWTSYFENILPDASTDTPNNDAFASIRCVVTNSIGQAFTFQVRGQEAAFVAAEDSHESRFNYMALHSNFSSFQERFASRYTGVNVAESFITYTLHVYPTSELESAYLTNRPAVFAGALMAAFLCTVILFILYDFIVERRQNIVLGMAVKSAAVVSSLFPKGVRDRLLEEAAEKQHGTRLSSYLNNGGAESGYSGLLGARAFNVGSSIGAGSPAVGAGGTAAGVKVSKPIAEFFPDTTVMFADIRGFTAWSSTREPVQVFILLETLYGAFDQLAKARRVFKVETVGDCYVAVTGLPEPRKDHAVAMARFARDCLYKMHELTKKLEVELGPDTGELSMRFGLHSGPVTAGVLRGEKSRFQLFGDTMNTASRMESTGSRGRIQVSRETANLIMDAGKPHWLYKREDTVNVKGKGEMQTYWLEVGQGDSAYGAAYVEDDMVNSGWAAGKDGIEDNKLKALMMEKTSRLIDWNVELLLKHLRQIVARREAKRTFLAGTTKLVTGGGAEKSMPAQSLMFTREDEEGTFLDEVMEVIMLPDFDAKQARKQRDPETIDLGQDVEQQLRNLVTNIAALYRQNAFHSFAHASHVTMSVSKLLQRIVAPADIDLNDAAARKGGLASTLHDHTYGITSDPLTQFACIFSALIHDADHRGVPNPQLAKENAAMAALYKSRSIAEQNSLDLAWNLLMGEDYDELRATIYADEDEMKRFRQLVVNSVMATDIMDKDLKALRNERWDRAFSEEGELSVIENTNRKATIVIEHLIQASDVSHTMQHWHIYRKWNERFFRECMKGFLEGRAEKDPSENWYKGEIGFFDFYIIPLAKKLKNCGVFGVSSDEYLTYAEQNRQEWAERGQEVVAEMIENLRNDVGEDVLPYKKTDVEEEKKDSGHQKPTRQKSEDEMSLKKLRSLLKRSMSKEDIANLSTSNSSVKNSSSSKVASGPGRTHRRGRSGDSVSSVQTGSSTHKKPRSRRPSRADHRRSSNGSSDKDGGILKDGEIVVTVKKKKRSDSSIIMSDRETTADDAVQPVESAPQVPGARGENALSPSGPAAAVGKPSSGSPNSPDSELAEFERQEQVLRQQLASLRTSLQDHLSRPPASPAPSVSAQSAQTGSLLGAPLLEGENEDASTSQDDTNNNRHRHASPHPAPMSSQTSVLTMYSSDDDSEFKIGGDYEEEPTSESSPPAPPQDVAAPAPDASSATGSGTSLSEEDFFSKPLIHVPIRNLTTPITAPSYERPGSVSVHDSQQAPVQVIGVVNHLPHLYERESNRASTSEYSPPPPPQDVADLSPDASSATGSSTSLSEEDFFSKPLIHVPIRNLTSPITAPTYQRVADAPVPIVGVVNHLPNPEPTSAASAASAALSMHAHHMLQLSSLQPSDSQRKLIYKPRQIVYNKVPVEESTITPLPGADPVSGRRSSPMGSSVTASLSSAAFD